MSLKSLFTHTFDVYMDLDQHIYELTKRTVLR